MFDLVHAMRTRVISSPAFDGSRILAAILFEQTMDREINGLPTARNLWDVKHVVPILKVDKGLADEQHNVQLMKPIDTLDDLPARANEHRMFGTKMRSVIKDADEYGVRAIVDQQFEYGERIRQVGLVPILEPEVIIDSPHKDQAETLLHDAIAAHLDALPADATHRRANRRRVQRHSGGIGRANLRRLSEQDRIRRLTNGSRPQPDPSLSRCEESSGCSASQVGSGGACPASAGAFGGVAVAAGPRGTR
jgi:hypothetical protein